MATATYPARELPCTALARLNPDGSALVLSGTQDIGTGTYTIMTQIAADALGLPIERVHFDLGDTQYPEAPLSAGSSTASSAGSAVRMTCLALRDELIRLAVADVRSPLHGLHPGDIEAFGGTLAARGDRKRSESCGDVVKRNRRGPLEVRFSEKEKPSRRRYSCHSFGAQFAEVSVDEELGIVRVRKLLGAFAAGRFLNRKTARNQLMGGMVWGLGFALEGRTVRDLRTGRLVTKDLADYHLPSNLDCPEIEVIMIDEDDPYVNDVGAKGIGEIGNVGSAAAIANAVYHATGKRVRDLPITLDKLMS